MRKGECSYRRPVSKEVVIPLKQRQADLPGILALMGSQWSYPSISVHLEVNGLQDGLYSLKFTDLGLSKKKKKKKKRPRLCNKIRRKKEEEDDSS